MMSTTPGTREPAVALDDAVERLRARAQVTGASACTFQNTPVMMFPRNSTTLSDVQRLQRQVDASQLASRLSQAIEPGGIELEILAEYRVDGVGAHACSRARAG